MIWLLYLVIPLLTVIVFYFVKRKLLWVAPVVSTVLYTVTALIQYSISGITPVELFNENEWRAFFILGILIQLVIVIVFTAVAYFIAYMLKKNRGKLISTLQGMKRPEA